MYVYKLSEYGKCWEFIKMGGFWTEKETNVCLKISLGNLFVCAQDLNQIQSLIRKKKTREREAFSELKNSELNVSELNEFRNYFNFKSHILSLGVLIILFIKNCLLMQLTFPSFIIKTISTKI